MELQMKLPESFGAPGANIDNQGRRSLSWSLLEPGELFRNQYVMAWVEVKERTPWRGEPLALFAHRRRGESWAREPFTDKAREELHRLIVPQLSRTFDTIWTEAHRAKKQPSTGLIDQATELLRWAKAQYDLTEMHTDGVLTFRPYERSHPAVVVWPEQMRRHTAELVATAWCDGEQVGWMAANGDLIPNQGATQ